MRISDWSSDVCSSDLLERTVHYMQRVGMEHIKKAVLEDPQRRKALHERLKFSLSLEQDPWKERLEQPQLKKEFEVITVNNLEVPACNDWISAHWKSDRKRVVSGKRG